MRRRARTSQREVEDGRGSVRRRALVARRQYLSCLCLLSETSGSRRSQAVQIVSGCEFVDASLFGSYGRRPFLFFVRCKPSVGACPPDGQLLDFVEEGAIATNPQ